MKNIHKLLQPSSLIWIFVHVILFLVGTIMLAMCGIPEYKPHVAILQGVGGSLIATGVAGEVLFLYVWLTDSTREKLSDLIRAGLLRIFPVRSVQIKGEYDSRLSTAKEIDIIGYGLSSLRQDYSHLFAQWSRKAKVRILILDPDFPSKECSYADQRDAEEKNPKGKIRQDVESLLETLRANGDIVSDRFQVRLLRTLPSVNMFRIDDETFWGPYFALRESRNTPTFLVRGGFLHESLAEHFDAIWQSKTLSVPAFPTP